MKYNPFSGRCKQKWEKWSMNSTLWLKKCCMLIVTNMLLVIRDLKQHCFLSLKVERLKVVICLNILDGKPGGIFFNLWIRNLSNTQLKLLMANLYIHSFFTKDSYIIPRCRILFLRNSFLTVLMITFVNCMLIQK